MRHRGKVSVTIKGTQTYEKLALLGLEPTPSYDPMIQLLTLIICSCTPSSVWVPIKQPHIRILNEMAPQTMTMTLHWALVESVIGIAGRSPPRAYRGAPPPPRRVSPPRGRPSYNDRGRSPPRGGRGRSPPRGGGRDSGRRRSPPVAQEHMNPPSMSMHVLLEPYYSLSSALSPPFHPPNINHQACNQMLPGKRSMAEARYHKTGEEL